MSDTSAATPSSRTAVVAVALDLFDRNGFDATSVEQIAQAAGSSRSTFFRQFGGKDDVVFADHELLLAQLRENLSHPHENPWVAVCDAAANGPRSRRGNAPGDASGTAVRGRTAVCTARPLCRYSETLTVAGRPVHLVSAAMRK